MSGSYVVIATRLDTVGEDGRRVKHYRGETLSGLSDADVARFKAAGAIAAPSNEAAAAAKEDPAGPNPAESSDAAAVTEPAKTGLADPQASDIVAAGNANAPAARRPAKAATAEAWRTYAVESGQLSREEADLATRDQLRDTLK